VSSNAGLLPIRQFDEHIRFTEQFAAAIKDLRDATSPATGSDHGSAADYGILADYEDQNDHDTLRSTPSSK